MKIALTLEDAPEGGVNISIAIIGHKYQLEGELEDATPALTCLAIALDALYQDDQEGLEKCLRGFSHSYLQ